MAKQRHLVTAYYSEWLNADSREEALDQLREKVVGGELSTSDWEFQWQETDDAVSDDDDEPRSSVRPPSVGACDHHHGSSAAEALNGMQARLLTLVVVFPTHGVDPDTFTARDFVQVNPMSDAEIVSWAERAIALSVDTDSF